MPLRCLDGDLAIHAFDLSSERWNTLAADNRLRRHLRMPCCQALVTLRKSKLGTQFFAHKVIGACTTASETEAHLRLKQLAVEVARSLGWDASTEVAYGTGWRADVLAAKGSAKVAIEIQWSPQSSDETLRRQERYAASGVRGLWLLRQRRFAISRALPAARVSVDDAGVYLAHLPLGSDEQTISVRDFLTAALTRRLRFGVPLDLPAVATINVGAIPCWKCQVTTDIVSSITIAYGPHDFRFAVADFGARPDLFAVIASHLPPSVNVGAIKRRFSRTMQTSYLSNGCCHCDALIGQHYEYGAYGDQRPLASFTFTVDHRWLSAFEPQAGECWGVYRTDEGIAADEN